MNQSRYPNPLEYSEIELVITHFGGKLTTNRPMTRTKSRLYFNLIKFKVFSNGYCYKNCKIKSIQGINEHFRNSKFCYVKNIREKTLKYKNNQL